MENKDTTNVTRFEFGKTGWLELSESKLRGELKNVSTIADRQAGRGYLTTAREFYVTLDHVADFKIEGPLNVFVRSLIAAFAFLFCFGLFWGVSEMLLGWMIGGWIGWVCGLGGGVYFCLMFFKRTGCCHLKFSCDGSALSAYCEGKRKGELSSFVAKVKEMRQKYMDKM